MKSVIKRQGNIKQNDVRVKLRKFCGNIAEIADTANLKPPHFRLLSDCLSNPPVILNYQQPIHFLTSLSHLPHCGNGNGRNDRLNYAKSENNLRV